MISLASPVSRIVSDIKKKPTVNDCELTNVWRLLQIGCVRVNVSEAVTKKFVCLYEAGVSKCYGQILTKLCSWKSF